MEVRRRARANSPVQAHASFEEFADIGQPLEQKIIYGWQPLNETTDLPRRKPVSPQNKNRCKEVWEIGSTMTKYSFQYEFDWNMLGCLKSKRILRFTKSSECDNYP